MARFLPLLLITAVVLIQLNSSNAKSETKKPKTVCYYESWSHWKVGESKMDVTDIGMFAVCLSVLLNKSNNIFQQIQVFARILFIPILELTLQLMN